MEQTEEKRIIKSVLSGNSNDFEKLVLAHQRTVYNLAYRMVGNEEDAEDLAQEAFVKAYKSLEGFRFDSKFSVWMYRLTTNICLDFLRSRRNKKTISLNYFVSEDDEEIVTDIADERLSPENELEKKELREAVKRGISRLPDDMREILLLREIGDMSYEEISSELELEVGTVKSRIFRARKKLCNILCEDRNFSYTNSSKE